MKIYKKTLSKAIYFLVKNREFTKTEMARYLDIERKHLYERILPELVGLPPEGMGIEIEALSGRLSRVKSYGIISVSEVLSSNKDKD